MFVFVAFRCRFVIPIHPYCAMNLLFLFTLLYSCVVFQDSSRNLPSFDSLCKETPPVQFRDSSCIIGPKAIPLLKNTFCLSFYRKEQGRFVGLPAPTGLFVGYRRSH